MRELFLLISVENIEIVVDWNEEYTSMVLVRAFGHAVFALIL